MLKTINITAAAAIEGWMSEQELTWLAEQAVERRCIVEIGSYLGRSTRALLDHTPGVVYAFDDWKGPRDVYVEDRSQLALKFMKNVEAFKTMMNWEETEGKLHMVVCGYEELYRSDYKVSPDMVFIDGSHEYEDVKRDILFWKDKLITGGLLCGHDSQFDDVAHAVNEVLGEVKVAESTSIWYKTI